ncbi:hypothetical protein [Priestia megaterium]|uniref:hypothetical protein n=1 Tax=Priestia megaterium TaxID=1404 RepID=UPI001A94C1B2|nr:hypothetical protein [Priestia megaterium]QSX20007.1 hypothetical protein J0P05_22645 [Priestia megaterium]
MKYIWKIGYIMPAFMSLLAVPFAIIYCIMKIYHEGCIRFIADPFKAAAESLMKNGERLDSYLRRK